jgi:hypothetical protein
MKKILHVLPVRAALCGCLALPAAAFAALRVNDTLNTYQIYGKA